MGSTSRYGRATINPNDPEALGICDGCGFLFNLRALRWQFEWCGTTMMNMQLRKCSQCLDVPQEQLRTIILPPDPPSVRDPRLEPFFVDQQNHYTISAPVGFPQLFPATSSMSVVLQTTSTLVVAFEALASMVIGLQAGFMIEPAFAAVASFEVELFIPPNFRITEDGDFRITEDGDRRITE